MNVRQATCNDRAEALEGLVVHIERKPVRSDAVAHLDADGADLVLVADPDTGVFRVLVRRVLSPYPDVWRFEQVPKTLLQSRNVAPGGKL